MSYIKQHDLVSCLSNYRFNCLDSPYGELKFAPPNPYFIDLRQMEAKLCQILTQIIKFQKMRVQNSRTSFYRKKNSRTLHNIAKGLVPLFAAICRYLPLTIRYLPLTIPLFATNHFTICRYLPAGLSLFAVFAATGPGLRKDAT